MCNLTSFENRVLSIADLTLNSPPGFVAKLPARGQSQQDAGSFIGRIGRQFSIVLVDVRHWSVNQRHIGYLDFYAKSLILPAGRSAPSIGRAFRGVIGRPSWDKRVAAAHRRRINNPSPSHLQRGHQGKRQCHR